MKKIFDQVLDTFENEDIKEFAIRCIDAAPPYFYKVGASSSGKYHPEYALGEMGLARHTVALVRILNHMLSVEWVSDHFTSRERDLLRTAGIVHDMWKSGTQEEYEQNKFTKFDHPLRAAKFVWNMDGLSDEERKYCSMAIASHMGQWNTDKKNPGTVLPKPESPSQAILHIADYLASRKDIEVKFDEMFEKKTPDIDTYLIDFGRHRGKTIKQVYKEDPGYITWAKEALDKDPARTLFRQFNPSDNN